MKNSDEHIEGKIDQTLQAFDGMERAKPKPFLYTRLKARLENETRQPQKAFFLSPALQRAAFVMILLVIILNIYTATRFLSGTISGGMVSTSEQKFIEEYYPATPTLYNISQTVSSQ